MSTSPVTLDFSKAQPIQAGGVSLEFSKARPIGTTQQPGNEGLTWDQVKRNLHSIANGTNDDIQQLKEAGIGASKSIAKGAAVIGDVATLGLTHLLPGSSAASGGIGANGTALNPTNENQQAGGYVGDLAMFELGSGIMESLSHLP